MNHLETFSFKTMKTASTRCQQKLNSNLIGSSQVVEQCEHCSELQGKYLEK